MAELTFEYLFQVAGNGFLGNTKFTEKQKKLFVQTFKNAENGLDALFALRATPKSTPLELRIKTVDFNFKHRSELDKFLRKNVNLGIDFKLDFSRKSTHPESMNQINIVNKDNKSIASINASFVLSEKGTSTLVINNLQGNPGFYKSSEPKEVRSQKLNLQKNELNKLNEVLGENWRVFFTKQIVNYANTQKISYNYRLPPTFNYLGSILPGEYVRQLRQYMQTAIKAGVPLTHIDASHVAPEVRQRFELNLKNKTINQEKQKLLIEKQKLKKRKLPKTPIK